MIKVENLSKKYNNKVIFDQLAFSVAKGELISISGASGTGKSTLLNIIGLLDIEYSGEVEINGHVIGRLTKKQRMTFIREEINYLFQNYALIDDDTVMENLMLALTYTKLSRKEKENKIKEVLNQFGLKNTFNQKVYTLSGGEQQRIALVRACIKPGSIFLADEPTGNLDKNNTVMVFNCLKKMTEEGKTVLIVTHDEQLAQRCDRMLVVPTIKGINVE